MKRGSNKKYLGSIVLGLNDALVELTGALAGLTLALQNSKIIATAGLISGIAASMSMAASEYLSVKAESRRRDAFISALYTGTAYIITVLFLISPYLILKSSYHALAFTLLIAVIIIFLFTYISSKKNFYEKFFEMLLISGGVAAISFIIGYLVRIFFGIEV